jgi:hypothetical protein
MLIAEMYAWYKTQGMTLYDGIIALYDKYGLPGKVGFLYLEGEGRA